MNKLLGQFLSEVISTDVLTKIGKVANLPEIFGTKVQQGEIGACGGKGKGSGKMGAGRRGGGKGGGGKGCGVRS
ncbi:MAG: hypothetical protein HQK58_08275 [Deltaproteobacteria bacterium]|nr:hypothetical protein [Deltaproteobacteria bacterium]